MAHLADPGATFGGGPTKEGQLNCTGYRTGNPKIWLESCSENFRRLVAVQNDFDDRNAEKGSGLNLIAVRNCGRRKKHPERKVASKSNVTSVEGGLHETCHPKYSYTESG